MHHRKANEGQAVQHIQDEYLLDMNRLSTLELRNLLVEILIALPAKKSR